MMNRPSFRTPLGRAFGLGSAKTGSGHWLVQRVTAVALVPLPFDPVREGERPAR